ncbi:MAG: peptidoglycan bridge formation glycyltransferase FemA/FemB family protein [Caldilineaceae bacterium]|nr:peptidoglycan bridge formation glycyltransferase FemA/FemB family protein [Caldilineaceae bacterium]
MPDPLQSPALLVDTARDGNALDAAWDAFVKSHSQAQLLQTSAWAALKARFGWERRLALVRQGDTIQAGASLLLRRAVGLSVAYVPRGPVVDWDDAALTARALAALEQEAHRAGAALLRLEPELADSPDHRVLLWDHGYRPSAQTVQPPSTVVLSLEGSEDAVLQRMKSKWRYNVRLAERKGVTVRPLARHELPIFTQLMDETGDRDGFALHSADYYAAAYDLLCPKWGTFLLAEFEGQPLAAIVVAACGPTAWYLWGASSSRERNRMPNHALQWAGMRWARAHGARRYDFWGIPDEIGQIALGIAGGEGCGVPVDSIPVDLELLPSHDLWGVYRFKQGFGGEVVRHVGTWDKAIRPVGARLFYFGMDAQRLGRAALGRLYARRDADAAPAQREVVYPAEWRATLADLGGAHVLQSWEWGSVKAQTGWQAARWAWYDPAGAPVAAAQLLTRRPADGLPPAVGYIPKGPTLDWSDVKLAEQVLAQIEAQARRTGCLFVKIDPDVEEYADGGIRLRNLLKRRGWRFSADQVQFKNTAWSDLTLGEDALLEQMKSKWRYNIRLAERRGIAVRHGSEPDLRAFYDLYAETGARDGFLTRPYAYYWTTWITFLRAAALPENPAGGALLLAEHPDEDRPVAGLFLLRYGDTAWYFYGASSERRRRDMPNYLLQWEAMRWARAHGCTRYDWWGAPTDLDDLGDGMQGVWQFKQGFGAEFRRHIGAWDYPVWPQLYRLYTETMPRGLAVLRRMRRGAQAVQSVGGVAPG